jgi:sensor histidine kinase regulating citrate/malate metabolism
MGYKQFLYPFLAFFTVNFLFLTTSEKKDIKSYKNFAKIKIAKNNEWLKIEYCDNTEGFDTQKIKDAFHKRYHGRGIKIIKHLACGLFFNHNGTAIKIFLKV